MKQVCLQTLGCRLNEAELETWSRDFIRQGFGLTRDPAEADLVVLNTCAVTRESVRKSRNLIRRAQRANPQAKLVISGCYASLSDQAADELGVDLIITNQDKDRLVEITREAFTWPTMPQAATEAFSLLAHGRQRAFIKVQDGCRYRCTYCVVTLARGEERSRSIADIIAEIQSLNQQGIHEIVLAGVHLGGYGADLGLTLTDLVTAVLRDTDVPRIRLGSVEPWDLPASFWRLFDNPRLMPHLHLPIQSGSDSVLRRMARRCKTAEFTGLVEQARQQVMDFTLTTDIIVGFPGETDEEWRQTLDYVDQIRFAHVHIFSYSARAGTKAASLASPVDRSIKRQRSQQLHALTAQHKEETMGRFIGRQFEVLAENQVGANQWTGYTPNFLRVNIRSTDDLSNRLVTVRLDRISEDKEAVSAQPL